MVDVTPERVDLGNLVDGSRQAVERVLSLENTSDHPLAVDVSAGADLHAAAALVGFRQLHAEEAASNALGVSTRAATGELCEEANMLELEMLAAGYGGLELGRKAPGMAAMSVTVPVRGSVQVLMSLIPASLHLETTSVGAAKPWPQVEEAVAESGELSTDDEQNSEDSKGGLDGPLEDDTADMASRDQGQQYTLQPLRGSVHLNWRNDDDLSPGAKNVEGGCVVEVRGQRCVSRLHADANDLVFDRCAPGKRYVKDFSIWNSSEMGTCFRISLADPTRRESLQLFDYETGDQIGSDRIEIGPFGNHRIVVAFVASEESLSRSSSAWDILWLAVENVMDPTNVVYVKVATFTTKEVAGSGLAVSCGDKILFGDCFAWEPVSRDITLRNTLQVPLSITLSSTLPNEVAFEALSLGGRARSQRGQRQSGRESANISESIAQEGDDENITSDLAFQEGEGGVVTSGVDDSRELNSDDSSDDVSEQDASGENRQQSKRLSFSAGESLSVRVWYTPVRSPAGPDISGRLHRRTFQVVVGQSATESRLISAEARVCESIVTLGARELNMGDCDVLKTFNASLTLFNLSDLPTVVAVECESKCITAAVESIRIEARQSFDLGLVFVPRTLNPEYAKEIKFINKNNRRHGCSVVTLTANNVDRRCISLHAVFYKVLDPGLTNEVKFGRIAANYPAIRVVRFQNVSNQVLVLGFDDTEGVTTFAPRWNMRKRTPPVELRRINSAQDSLSPSSSLVQKSLLGDASCLDSASPTTLQIVASPRKSLSRTIMSLVDTDLLTTLNSMEGNMDPSVSAPEHGSARSSGPRCGLGDSEEFATFIRNSAVVDGLPCEDCEVDLTSASSGLCADREELIRKWMNQDFTPLSLQVAGVLSGMEEELKWAKDQLRPGRSLVHYINSGALVRSNHLVLSPGEESVLCVAIVVGENAVSRRAVEHSLKVRLLEFDSTRLERRAKACAWRGAMFSDTSFEDPPPREVVLSVHVCRSPVKIRPLHILNFGVMTAGMQRHRHFVIDNSDSSAGLVFSIRKTRSVASDDIRLGNGFDSGRLGAVRPFSLATIPFVFRPSLAGAFREEVVVSNAMDSSASQTLTVKATVLKRWSFHVLTQSLTDFGVLEFGSESAHVLRFDVHNDTEKLRKFAVSVIDRRRSSASVPLPKVLISVLEKIPSSGDCSRSAECSVELAAKRSKLEHYLNKGKAAKAEVIRKEISALEAKEAETAALESSDSPTLPSNLSSLFDSPSDRKMKLSSRKRGGSPPGENFISFHVEGGSQTTIEVWLRVDRLHNAPSQSLSTWADQSSSFAHVRTRSLLETADLSASTDRLESVGLPRAGMFKFTLGVYETKDRETCHSINCTTFVTAPIPRSESTLDNSELFIPRKDFPLGPPVKGFVAAAASAAASAAFVAASAAAKAIRPFGEKDADSRALSSQQIPALPRVDFGSLRLGVAERRPIQIRNTSNRYAEYVSLVPNTADGSDGIKGDAATLQNRAQTSVEVSGLDRALAPGEIYTFFVSFTALIPGQHSRSLILKPVLAVNSSEGEAHRLILSGFCVSGDVVTIRTSSHDRLLVEEAEGVPEGVKRGARHQEKVNGGQELDLGYGVVDPARDYAIVKLVSACSEVDVDVLLTARSNLSGQVLVFTDAGLSMSAENVLIRAREAVQLWIAVAPRLRKSEIRDGVVRKLVGGLQLLTGGVDGNRLAESTIRFSASVGASHFSVKPQFVDLGVCSQLDDPSAGVFLSGAIMLTNKSVGGESRFEVMCTSDRVFLEPPVEGVLGPKEPSGSQKGPFPRPAEKGPPSFQEVRFQLMCKGRGFIREVVYVKNILSPSLSCSVPVSAFVDPGVFESYVDGLSTPVASFQVYLSVREESWTVCYGGRHSWTVASKRCAKDSESFVPMSNLLLQISPTAQEPKSFRSPFDDIEVASDDEDTVLGGWDAPYRVCGQSFDCALNPGFRRSFSINLLPPTRLSAREGALLRSGRNCTVEGGVVFREGLRPAFEDDTSGVMLQRIHLNYCVSQLAFGDLTSLLPTAGTVADAKDKPLKDSEPSSGSATLANTLFTSNIGDFGHCSGWKEEHVTATVSNPGESLLEFGLQDLPHGFTVTKLGCAGSPDAHEELTRCNELSCEWHKLDPLQSIVIGLKIDPTKVKQEHIDVLAGQVSIELKIVNRMNPFGGLTWVIAGRLTSPRLQFEGLEKTRRSRAASSTRSALTIPELQVPGSMPSASSFRVKNVSDARVSLDVQFEQSTSGSGILSAGLAVLDLVDVDVSEGISGVNLRKATLNPDEVLSVCVTVVPQSHENERAILDTAFATNGSIEFLLGLVRFSCVVSGASEPSEIVHVRLSVARGESILVEPKELSFSRLLSREFAARCRRRGVEPTAAELQTHMQLFTVSNQLGLTDVGVWMKVVGVPSGTTPILIPQSTWIEPSSSVDVRIGLATNMSNRSALYGTATLLIFDQQSLHASDAPPPDAEPIASVELHIDANENEEEDGRASQAVSEALDEQSDHHEDVAGSVVVPGQPVTAVQDTVVSQGSAPCQPSAELLDPPVLRSPCDVAAESSLQNVVPSYPLQESSSTRGAAFHSRESDTSVSGDSLQRNDSVQSQFTIKGCAQVVGDVNRFELNCGQFSPSSEPYVRRLSLENRSNAPIEYKCIRIRARTSAAGIGDEESRAEEDSWLTVNRSGGVLAPSGERGGSQSLVLTMQRSLVNVYSAYLVFEAGDGCEVKTVRLLMEVVADGATPGVADSYFSVLCDGRGGDSRFIDYNTIIFGQLYRHRSFVIRNNSTITLEFMLASDLPETLRSELTFSLTNAVLRKTSRVVVPPKSRLRVFLLYRPMVEVGDSAEAGLIRRNEFSVRVTCRLVKDYQGSIRIISECRRQSLSCSTNDFLFDCADLVHSIVNPSSDLVVTPSNLPAEMSDIRRKPAVLALPQGSESQGGDEAPRSSGAVAVAPEDAENAVRPACGLLEIRNCSVDSSLVFCIRNPSRFFEVDCDDEVTLSGTSNEGGSSKVLVTVRPNLERIRDRAHSLLREKYVEEHISVYNRGFPREFLWIRIRLAIGGAAMEFSAVTHKRAFAFSTLESTIANFLSQFSAFWAQFRRDNFTGLTDASSATRSDTVLHADSGAGPAFASKSTLSRKVSLRGWAKHVETAPQKSGYELVRFELMYCTDELIYYCLKNPSPTGMQMASMLYSYVFKHDVFATFLLPEGQELEVPEMMLSWVGQLGHFLSFFPDKRDAFRGLTELEDRFRARIDPEKPSGTSSSMALSSSSQ